MANHLNTVTVTSFTFEFTEQELEDLVKAVGESVARTATSVRTYKLLKDTLDASRNADAAKSE